MRLVHRSRHWATLIFLVGVSFGASCATPALFQLGAAGTRDVFTAKQVTRVYIQRLAADPPTILPLLTPLGEKAWAARWDPTILSASPEVRVGTVFSTLHQGATEPTVWIMRGYDEARGTVHYVRITPDSDVTEIRVTLRRLARGESAAEVQYIRTAFTKAGNALLEAWTEDRFLRGMKEWEDALNHYLRTGRKLATHG